MERRQGLMETELKLCKCAGFMIYNNTSQVYSDSIFVCLFCAGDPHNDANAQGDAFKTLFVARVVSVLCVDLYLHGFL